MGNEFLGVSADLDVDSLMARIRESAKGRKASTSQHSVESLQDKNLGSILESIEVGSIIQELHCGGLLTEVINQIPLKAGGRRGKLEFRVKKFLKWLVHWNTEAQADFNHSVMRSLGLVAERLHDVQRNFAKIERELKEESKQRAEIRRQADEQENRLLAMFEDLNEKVNALGAQILGFENRMNDRVEQLRKETNQQMSEQESRLSAVIEEVDRKADAAGAGSAELEQKTGRELERLKEKAIGEIEELKGQVEQTVQATHHINEQMHSVSAKLGAIEQLKGQAYELSARLGEIDRNAGATAVQCAGLEEKINHDVDEMRMRILRAERSVTAPRYANNSSPFASEPVEKVARSKPPAVDHKTNGQGRPEANTLLTTDKFSDPQFDYFLFEHRFRGTVSEIKRRQSIYVELFLGKENVIDLGCGRGEFVELLSGNGVNVTGIDNNQDMVEFCRDRGVRVVLSDIFDYLGSLPNATLDGIAALQVVEHLSFEQILKLINLCGEKLKSGGVIVVETVNTNCSAALANFYLDPSHIRPVPAEMLRFVFEQAPFEVRSLRFSSPIAGSNLTGALDVTSGLPQEASLCLDYAVVAHRR